MPVSQWQQGQAWRRCWLRLVKTHRGGNPGPVEEVVNGEGENPDAAGQEEPVDEDVGRIAGEDETEESKANREAGKNLDGTIARGANDGTGSTEASSVYEFKDNKTTGTVTVVKKWDDQSNNAERPVVDVSLSTAKPSKNPLGHTVTFHADAEKGLTFADGSTKNEVVYASSGQVVSGSYKGLTGGSGVVRWYTDKTYQTQVELNADGTLTAPLTGDVDVWPKEVTFEIKGYDTRTYTNNFRQVIPSTVTTIAFTDEVMPADATLISVDADGDDGVVAWTEGNEAVMKVSTQITGLKVQAAKNSSQMFYNKTKIQTIDFTNLDTASVTDMSYMFVSCSGLTSLDLSSLETKNVKNTSYMFFECKSLTYLNLSGWDTTKVTNMSSMFYCCQKMPSLNLSWMKTTNVVSMRAMFSGCYNLTYLNLSGWNTHNVRDMNSMFMNCSRLINFDLSLLDTANVTDMGSMFAGCSGLNNLDLSPLKTTKVTNMESMFHGCSKLTNLDLTFLNMENVTNISSMFYNCVRLTSLNISGWRTIKVMNVSSMFRNCSRLTDLNLTSLDTSQVTNMNYMFSGCSGLANLDLSSFNTQNVTEMSSMFDSCRSLTSLDLSSFDTSNVKYMNSMFIRCDALTTLTTGSSFKFVGTSYSLSGTWKNTAGETFTSGKFPSNVADTYTKIAS